MSTEENKALNQQVLEACNRRDVDGVIKHCAPDSKFQVGSQTLDLAGYKQFLSTYFSAFPDTEFTIEDLIAEGDKVAVCYTFRGTHLGEFQGILPTGKQVNVMGMTMARVANGKVVEARINGDPLGILQQLGVVQPTTSELPWTALPATDALPPNVAPIKAEQTDTA